MSVYNCMKGKATAHLFKDNLQLPTKRNPYPFDKTINHPKLFNHTATTVSFLPSKAKRSSLNKRSSSNQLFKDEVPLLGVLEFARKPQLNYPISTKSYRQNKTNRSILDRADQSWRNVKQEQQMAVLRAEAMRTFNQILKDECTAQSQISLSQEAAKQIQQFLQKSKPSRNLRQQITQKTLKQTTKIKESYIERSISPTFQQQSKKVLKNSFQHHFLLPNELINSMTDEISEERAKETTNPFFKKQEQKQDSKEEQKEEKREESEPVIKAAQIWKNPQLAVNKQLKAQIKIKEGPKLKNVVLTKTIPAKDDDELEEVNFEERGKPSSPSQLKASKVPVKQLASIVPKTESASVGKEQQMASKPAEESGQDQLQSLIEEIFYFIDCTEAIGSFRLSSKDCYRNSPGLAALNRVSSYYLCQQFLFEVNKMLTHFKTFESYLTFSSEQMRLLVKDGDVIDEIAELENKLEIAKRVIKQSYQNCKKDIPKQEQLLTINPNDNYHSKCVVALQKEFEALLKESPNQWKRLAFLIEIHCALMALVLEECKDYEGSTIQNCKQHVQAHLRLMI